MYLVRAHMAFMPDGPLGVDCLVPGAFSPGMACLVGLSLSVTQKGNAKGIKHILWHPGISPDSIHGWPHHYKITPSQIWL